MEYQVRPQVVHLVIRMMMIAVLYYNEINIDITILGLFYFGFILFYNLIQFRQINNSRMKSIP